ncbi:MAG TPA: hypothetical protein VKY22_23780 [Bradyrhizobium sp.]|nr:hypothetical protein [Bradyrhizobium sp.]
MSVSIEAVDRDLIQDGIAAVLEVPLVELEVVTAAVVVVVALVVVVATEADGSAALTAEKSANDRLAAADAADGAAPANGAFNPKKEKSIDPVPSVLLSVLAVCGLNDMR